MMLPVKGTRTRRAATFPDMTLPPPTMPLQPPTFADVLAARGRIRDHLPRTPLRSYPALDRMVGAEVWVKHENLLPTGAFKVRGGINLMSRLDAATRAVRG